MSIQHTLIRRAFAAVMAAVVASPTVQAASASGLPWSAPLSKATQGQAVIVDSFPGPEGLTALIIGPAPGVEDHGKVVGWGLPNGLLMVGNLYDRNGRNLNQVVQASKGLTAEEGRTVSGEKLEGLWESVRQSLAMGGGVVEGNASASEDATVFIFFDPQCGHCKRLYKEIHQQEDLLRSWRFVWLPVSILGQQGIPMAAHALTGPDAFRQVMTLSKEGLKNLPYPDEKARSLLAINQVLLELSGQPATPAMLWRDAQGVIRFEKGYDATRFKAMFESMKKPVTQ